MNTFLFSTYQYIYEERGKEALYDLLGFSNHGDLKHHPNLYAEYV